MKRSRPESKASVSLLDRLLGSAVTSARKKPHTVGQDKSDPNINQVNDASPVVKEILASLAESRWRRQEANVVVQRIVDVLGSKDSRRDIQLRAIRLLAIACDQVPDARPELNAHIGILVDLAHGSLQLRDDLRGAAEEGELRMFARRLLERLRVKYGDTDIPTAKTATILMASKSKGVPPVAAAEPLSDGDIAALLNPSANEGYSAATGSGPSSSQAAMSPAQCIAQFMSIGLLEANENGWLHMGAPFVFKPASSPLLSEVSSALSEVESCLAALAPAAQPHQPPLKEFEDDDDDDDGGFKFGDDVDETEGSSAAVAGHPTAAFDGDGWEDADDAVLPPEDDDGVADHGNLLEGMPYSFIAGYRPEGTAADDTDEHGPTVQAAAAGNGAVNASSDDDPLLEQLRDALKPLVRRLLQALRTARALCFRPLSAGQASSLTLSSSSSLLPGGANVSVEAAVELQRAAGLHVQRAYKRADDALAAARRVGIDLRSLKARAASTATAAGGTGSSKSRNVHVPLADSDEAQRVTLQSLLALQRETEMTRAKKNGDSVTAEALALASGKTSAASSSAGREKQTKAQPKSASGSKGGARKAGAGASGGNSADPLARIRKALAAQKRASRGGAGYARDK